MPTRLLTAAALVVGGLLVVVAAVAAPAVSLGGVAAGVLAGLLAIGWIRDADVGAGAGPARVGLLAAVGTTGCWLAVTGLVLLLGSASGEVLLLGGLLLAGRGWSRLVGPRPAPPVPATLSTAQLCLAWQRSGRALSDLPPGAPLGEVVLLRARLLDEIESRDPDGFARWLDTGARAGSDPGRYLAGGR